jgi:NADH-quinone oxidoreductase subunit L
VSPVVWALLLAPFLTAALVVVLGHRAESAARGVAVGGGLVTLALAAVVALPHLGDAAPLTTVLASTDAVQPGIALAARVDPLAAVLLLLAATVAALVQVYSLGYLAEDPRYPSYAALVAVFTGAMCTVVVADDLWVLLVGWELMGACSYFLIAHHWELEAARAGAVKAFVMTRTADLGLLFAILLLGERFESYRISEILAAVEAEAPARDALWLPALLLVVAVLGKSAQMPFHTWLPDAMPGPTPISALIHAATMVAAGVFLVARMYPVFLSAPSSLTLLAGLAAVTMLVGALAAMVADDLKRVLAWSTVSQLACMFGALAMGAWAAGVLHLLAHGAFKALLFLAAGAVAHAIGSTSLHRMGGLRTRLPDTFLTMTVGLAALAGVAPLVGFFTKDAVIAGALEEARHGRLVWPWVGWLLVASMLVTALLTMAYALRAWILVFLGEPSPTTLEQEPHEPPWSMRAPLYLLCVPTLLGGLLVVDPAALLGPAGEADLVHLGESTVLLGLLALTALVVWLAYRRRGTAMWRRHRMPLPAVDRVYDAALVRPTGGLAALVRAGDRDVVEGWTDGTAATVRGAGGLLRRAQSGNVQTYLMVVVAGAVLVAVLAGAGA